MGFPYSSGDILTASDLNQSSGLVLVKSQTIGSAVSSVTVTDAFSSTFENYKITMSGSVFSLDGYSLRFRFGNGGTILSGADYWGGGYAVIYDSTTQTHGQYGANYLHIGFTSNVTNRTSASFDVMAPYPTSAATSLMGFTGGYLSGFWFSYLYAPLARVTDLHFYTGGGTMTGGTIRVYGYNNG